MLRNLGASMVFDLLDLVAVGNAQGDIPGAHGLDGSSSEEQVRVCLVGVAPLEAPNGSAEMGLQVAQGSQRRARVLGFVWDIYEEVADVRTVNIFLDEGARKDVCTALHTHIGTFAGDNLHHQRQR